MNRLFKTFGTVVALSLFAVCCARAGADEANKTSKTIDPLASVSNIVEWFSNLNAKFDQLTLVAEQKQFEARVDDIRRGLYRLEKNSQEFLSKIPDKKPTGALKQKLQGEATDLLGQTDKLKRELMDVGADLRLRDGEKLEVLGWTGVQTRAMAVQNTSTALISDSEWDPLRIRQELTAGLEAVRRAQKEATQFASRLANKALPIAKKTDSAK